MSGLQLPRWIVPAAGFAAAIWAVAMWWMVATLPNAGTSSSELDLIVARAEIDRLEVSVDELSQQISALYEERGALSLRLEALEQAPASVATRAVPGSSAVAGAPPTTSTPRAADKPDDEASRDATATPTARPSATPTSEPTARPTAAPTATPAPLIETVSSPPEAVQYFTDGRDRYNCRDFDSWEEAQAAYEANLPGDPNKIDIDRNGIACEALR